MGVGGMSYLFPFFSAGLFPTCLSKVWWQQRTKGCNVFWHEVSVETTVPIGLLFVVVQDYLYLL